MAFGYHGRYLRVDVSNAHAEFRSLDDSLLRQFLGGAALA